MTQVPLFGSSFYSVKETEPPRAARIIAINIFGLHIIEPSTKVYTKHLFMYSYLTFILRNTSNRTHLRK